MLSGSFTLAHLLNVRTVTVGVSSLRFHISYGMRNVFNLLLLRDCGRRAPSNHAVLICAVLGPSI